jgi:hypothetical protein
MSALMLKEVSKDINNKVHLSVSTGWPIARCSFCSKLHLAPIERVVGTQEMEMRFAVSTLSFLSMGAATGETYHEDDSWHPAKSGSCHWIK